MFSQRSPQDYKFIPEEILTGKASKVQRSSSGILFLLRDVLVVHL